MSSTSSRTLERLAAGVVMVGFASRIVPRETRALIERGVRSFILFARNVGTLEQVQALTAELRDLAGQDAIIAIDHEGGRVNRFRECASPWPSPMACAATGDLELTREASRLSAQELAAMGITLNLAPVADILTDYHNPTLTTRCFSDCPDIAAAFVAAFVDGHSQAGVRTSAKHFPGHGGTPVDSHVALPQVEHSRAHLLSNDMVPFIAAVKAGVSSLMISHAWYARLDREKTPGTISPTVHRLARDCLGFQGPIVSDSMEMGAMQGHMRMREAGVRAILAGCDLLTVSHRAEQQLEVLEGMIEAVENGRLSVQRLEEANRRIEMLRMRPATDRTPFPAGGASMAEEIARRAVTIVCDEHQYLPLRVRSSTPLGVVTFPAVTSSQVENETASQSPLLTAVQSFHPLVMAALMDGLGDPLNHLDGVDTVIVGTASATGRREQVDLVRRLLETGKRVIVLGLRDPFDILSFPDTPCYLVAYDDSSVATRAAAAVIFGESDAVGRLPVMIPGMYRRGHGLRLSGQPGSDV